ncbi:MAG: hypothetical protein LBD13_07200 [Spirochaetaceae bacterium]|jgi:G3E family GTPase|nr:hypothetical protein [Spirochaetaceae bacterium]
MAAPITELILVTGFLGSGKTALLRHWLEVPPKTGIIITEGRQGSALASSFLPVIEGILERRHWDYILAETSGFTRPALLHDLVIRAEERSRGRLRFGGMICVIDALRFLKLFAAVVSLYEQAASADCFVLSKTALAEPSHIQGIQDILHTIRPLAPVFRLEENPLSFQAIREAIPRASRGKGAAGYAAGEYAV